MHSRIIRLFCPSEGEGWVTKTRPNSLKQDPRLLEEVGDLSVGGIAQPTTLADPIILTLSEAEGLIKIQNFPFLSPDAQFSPILIAWDARTYERL